MRLATALLVVCFAPRLSAQEPIPVLSMSLARSEVFDLRGGDSITVVPVGPAGIVLDSYIYQKYGDTPRLVDMDDPESTTHEFKWTVPSAGRYYVLVQNNGSQAGSFRVSVARGKGPSAPVAIPNYSVMRIYYATDRLRTGSNTPAQFYSGNPDESGTLSYGICVVTLPLSHDMGELEGPSIFKLEFRDDPEKHIVLKTIEPENKKASFFGKVRDRVNGSKKHEALVFVHGYRNTFEDAARRAAQIAHDLGFEGAPILFSWSSHGSVQAYTRDTRNADLGALALEKFLRELEANGVNSVHIVAHSMGGSVVSKALESIGRDASGPRFSQVALIAPDIDTTLFRSMARNIKGAAERVTLYASSKDLATEGSSLARRGQGKASADPWCCPA